MAVQLLAFGAMTLLQNKLNQQGRQQLATIDEVEDEDFSRLDSKTDLSGGPTRRTPPGPGAELRTGAPPTALTGTSGQGTGPG